MLPLIRGGFCCFIEVQGPHIKFGSHHFDINFKEVWIMNGFSLFLATSKKLPGQGNFAQVNIKCGIITQAAARIQPYFCSIRKYQAGF